MAAPKKVPLPRARPHIPAMPKAAAKQAVQPASQQATKNVRLPPQAPKSGKDGHSAFAQANVGLRGALFASYATIKPLARPAAGPFSVAPTTSTSAADIALIKQVLEATRKGNDVISDVAQKSISDPVARKLAEWIILRSDNTKPSFQRYVSFIETNPSWPHSPLFTRRAENALWNDKLDDGAVRAFFANRQPTTAKGRYMLARALLAKGDRAGAEALVRHAWRYQDCSSDVEKSVIEMFGSMITRADHLARMEQRLYVDDVEAGMRAAERLGGNHLAIARAWTAVIKKAKNAKTLLDAVPVAARQDAGYILARVIWLRRADQLAEAAKLILTAPKNTDELIDTDQWWQERRVLVRDLLDNNDAQTAYRVAREAAPPKRGNYRVDHHFTAGWIALRYLNDPKTAAEHFARINEGTVNPLSLIHI